MLQSHSVIPSLIQTSIYPQLFQTLSLLVIGFLSLRRAECRMGPPSESFSYESTACRAHSVSLTDFGGVGDGATSNTKAFAAAISHLSQYASDGGGQLYVPAGKWVTGCFNLTSRFTLFLHRDAVILGSQVRFLFPPTTFRVPGCVAAVRTRIGRYVDYKVFRSPASTSLMFPSGPFSEQWAPTIITMAHCYLRDLSDPIGYS